MQKRLACFEKQTNELRALLKIPGMSAVIIRDQEVLWAKGFGYADLENRISGVVAYGETWRANNIK